MSATRPLSLYNGVSDRSRGWKSRRAERADEGYTFFNNARIFRFDGRTNTTSPWDCLRRDPDLWFRNGDCYIHLYAQGQSNGGPSFKIPFSALLQARCRPLVERSMSHEVQASPLRPRSAYHVPSATHNPSKQNRLELYIPAPAGCDKRQAYDYHLATRNFFALLFRRPLVGEHLGAALIELLNIMREFRSAKADNLADLNTYLVDEGYLNLKAQPTHSLAILHMAEEFQLRDMYIDAFAHCCGMSDQLFLSPEYQLVSSATRRLLRRARVELDIKLGQMGNMLSTFLQDELSESHLGLYPGARAHLDRFRTLLHGYYTARFGNYPPPADAQTKIFTLDVFRTMRADFEALYQHLVDKEFDPSENIQLPTQGGLCTLQSVQSFDSRHHFATLDHPLPKVPEVPQPAPTKRFSWFNKPVKPPTGQRAETLVAMIKATNVRDVKLLENGLVRLYRRFEEDSIYFPLKADKQENLNPADGRKVRWILIYALYQTLLHATEPPPEVRSCGDAPYHLSIATENLPPWSAEQGSKSPGKGGQISRNSSFISTGGWCTPTEYSSVTPDNMSLSIEIKPDIDYLGLSQELPPKNQTSPGQARSATMPRRTITKKNLSRESTIRRSLRLFSNNRQTSDRLTSALSSPSLVRKSSPGPYHEILVQGYGNGTNDVEVVSTEKGAAVDASLHSSNTSKGGATASRSASTSSDSSHNSAQSKTSTASAGSGSTAATSILSEAADFAAVLEDSQYYNGLHDEDDSFMHRRPILSPPTISHGACTATPTTAFHTIGYRKSMYASVGRSGIMRHLSLSAGSGAITDVRPLTAHSSTNSLQNAATTQNKTRHRRASSTHVPKHLPLFSAERQQQYSEYEAALRAAESCGKRTVTTTITSHITSKSSKLARSQSMLSAIPPSLPSPPLLPSLSTALSMVDPFAIPPVPPVPRRTESQTSKRTLSHKRSKSSTSRRMTIGGGSSSTIGGWPDCRSKNRTTANVNDDNVDLLDWEVVASGGLGYTFLNGSATGTRPASMVVADTTTMAAKEEVLLDWDLYNDLGGFKEFREIRAPKRTSTIW